MEIIDLLIMLFVLTAFFSFVALGSSIYIICRMIKRERYRLDETEKHAFELFDAIFQSFIPRTLVDKLSHIYRTEIDPNAMSMAGASMAASVAASSAQQPEPSVAYKTAPQLPPVSLVASKASGSKESARDKKKKFF